MFLTLASLAIKLAILALLIKLAFIAPMLVLGLIALSLAHSTIGAIQIAQLFERNSS